MANPNTFTVKLAEEDRSRLDAIASEVELRLVEMEKRINDLADSTPSVMAFRIYENDIKELKGKADFVSSVMNAQEERLQALEEAAREVKASKSPPNSEEADETANQERDQAQQALALHTEEAEKALRELRDEWDNETKTRIKYREVLRQRDEAMNERDTLVIKCKLLESRISAAHKATEDARERATRYREALEAYADEENWEQEQESAYKDHWAPTEHRDTHVLFRVDGADLHGFTLAQHALKEGGAT